MPPRSPTRIGRYQIVDRLGEGGMGVVYLATDPLLQRTVAIKTLSVYNEELAERFAREARSAAGLKHQHIITIYDVGEDEGRPFLAMEYVDGETLSEMIRRRAPLPTGRKLQLIGELCSGLGYAHRTGIIHRDIKPANVIVTTDGMLKILDFGLARLANDAMNAGLTRAGMLIGTPYYMSPEQVAGERVDHRSDIFAVGLVLYEFLGYQKAYTGDSPHVVLHKIVHTAPPPLRASDPDLDPELERVVMTAIEKDPDRRYQSLEKLGADLNRIRARLDSSQDATVVVVRPGSEGSGSAKPPSGHGSTLPTPPNIPNLAGIARRRAAQIERYVNEALEHFAAESYDAAIEQCELAAVLDPNDSRVLDLLRRAHRAIEDRQIRDWLDEAQGCLSRGILSEAERLIGQSLQLQPNLGEALALQRSLQERRREQERAAERVRAVRSAVERARTNFEGGALEAAIRCASEALAYDPGQEEAKAIRESAKGALEERRRAEELERAAYEAVALARDHAEAGDIQGAIEQLRALDSPLQIVADSIADLEAQLAAVERRRREEEELRRRRALEEVERRRQAERLAREHQEALRRQREEEERQRLAELERRREQVEALCADARTALSEEHFDEAAAALGRARALEPDRPGIAELLLDVERGRAAAEDAKRRSQAVERDLAEARGCLQEGELTAALRHVSSAASLDPGNAEAERLRTHLSDLIEQRRLLEEQRSREEAERRKADVAVHYARRLFASGEHEKAIQALQRFAPRALVAPVLEELSDAWLRLQREQEQAAASQREQERLRAESERREAEAAERAAAEHRARAEAEARARGEAEQEARAEAEARARGEAEHRARAEAEARARAEAEHQARAEADARARAAAEQRRADSAVRDARRLFAVGKHRQAIRALEVFEPRALVAPVLEELVGERRRLERERDEASARKREEERLQAEAAAAAKEARSPEERRPPDNAAIRAPSENPSLVTEVREGEEQTPRIDAGVQGRVTRALALSRNRVASLAIAALLISGVAGSGWVIWRRPAATPSPAPAPSPATRPEGVDHRPSLAAAEERLGRGLFREAAEAAAAVLRVAPDDARAADLSKRARAAGVAAAVAARQRAESAHGASEPAFKEAVARMAEADALTQPTDTPRAVALYDDAAQFFHRAATTAWPPSRFVAEAEADYKAGRISGAITNAQEALNRDRGNRGAANLLARIGGDAEKRATAARNRALTGGAGETTAFKSADAKLADGRRTTGGVSRQVALFDEAARLFEESDASLTRSSAAARQQIRRHTDDARTALEKGDLRSAAARIREALALEPTNGEALAVQKQIDAGFELEARNKEIDAVLTRAKVIGDKEAVTAIRGAIGRGLDRPDLREELKRREDAVTAAASAAPPAAPGKSSPAPSSGAPTEVRASDRAEILKVLERYAASHASLDAGKVAEAAPYIRGAEEARLRDSFRNLKSYVMAIRAGEPVVVGSTATVACTIDRTIQTANSGTRRPPSESVVLELQRIGDQWLITGRR
jgi:serine/threonine-protein kinase